MAVPEQIPVVNYVADGIVKKFDVPFEYDQQSDLHVYVDGIEPTIDKYFFADNAFNFYIAPTSGQDVKIKRITPKERDTDYNLHTNTVRPKALNTDFDRLWYVLQEVFSDVGGLSQAVQDEIIARIQGDEDLLNQLTAEISARMLGDEAITEDLKNYINNIIALIIGDPSFNGIDADKVNDASGETQQQVNYNGGSKWHSRVGGYQVKELAILDNGDIVKSTVNGNTNDPNMDMTGWLNWELDQKIRNGQIINLVSDFKAIGGADCSAQIRSAILEALRTGKALYVPSTTAPYLYAKNQLTFKIGVDVNDISPNACLFIYGDGQASQFKMLDGQIDQLYSSSFRFEISRNMGAFYFKDFFVDNNARGSTPPPDESKYIYEQSHTFSFAGGVGTTLDNITYENMTVKDPAADAFNNSYRGVCGTVRHINPIVRDRTRVRADIQEGFGAKNIIISNPLVHSIEAEATIAPTNEFCFIQINGGTCEVLDIAGNSELDNLFVETNNVRVTGATNLGLIKKLTVNGGQLRINKDNARFPYLKDALFNRVRVLHPYNDVTGAVTSLGYLRRPTCAGTIEWIEPEHVIDYEGTLPVAATGELITNSGGTSIVSADVGLYNLIIRRAKFDPRIPKSIYAYRMGTVVLDNNQYGGTDCAIDWYATSGSATDLTVIGGDYSKVTGTALKIGGVSEGHKLKLTGDNWTGVKASSWKLLSGSLSTYAPAIYNYRKLTVDTLPTIALAKDVFQLGNIASAVGSVIEYQCTASSLTAPTYVCSKQLGLYAAATASLPVLTVNEKWARAHDTTTNTMKTWTGSAWI